MRMGTVKTISASMTAMIPILTQKPHDNEAEDRARLFGALSSCMVMFGTLPLDGYVSPR